MRSLKPYLHPYLMDVMFTDQVDNKSAGWGLNEVTAEQYLADVKRYADAAATPPKTKFQFNPKKVETAPAQKKIKLKKFDARVIREGMAKVSPKRKKLLRTMYTKEEVEAIAAASYLKGLKSVKDITDEEHETQVIIALKKATETTDQWNDYLQDRNII